MNRSFRAPEAPMARSLGAVIKEKDEELALFLEMRRREKERSDSLLLDSSEDLDRPLGSKPDSSPIFKIVHTAAAPVRKTGVDDFLNSDSEKNDYDWLLTPPGTPLFPSLEKEPSRSPVSLDGTPKSRPTALKSRLANPLEHLSRGNSLAKLSASNSGANSSNMTIRRPSSSGGSGSVSSRLSGGGSVSSRPSGGISGSGSLSSRLSGAPTSTSRPSSGPSARTVSASKPSSRPATPTGRSTIPTTAKSSRPSTPTSRATLPAKPASVPRSVTPSRSSTPTSRPSLGPPSKPSTRPSTPTRRPPTPSSIPSHAAPPVRPSLAPKAAPVASKSVATPPRSGSPSVRSRSWKPSEMPGFSLEAPPNLRTSLADRPTSATRGRPGAPSSRSSSIERPPAVERVAANRPRRQSCSPSRGRAPNVGSAPSGSSVPAVSRSHVNGGDHVSAAMIGSKMVERVVNARRLAPPRQDNLRTSLNSTGKASSPDSSGFGRTLSKKSLDMAMRHMDIRQSIPNNLRPLMTNVPASSMYSVRSGPARSRVFSASDSPLATSSNCSSERSVNNNNFFLEGSETGDDDIRIER